MAATTHFKTSRFFVSPCIITYSALPPRLLSSGMWYRVGEGGRFSSMFDRFGKNLFLHLQSTTSILLVFYFATLSVTNDRPIIFIMVRQGVPTHCSVLQITLRRSTLGRTPLDGWLARCRYLYLIHMPLTRDKHPSPSEIRSANPASKRPQNHALDHAATVGDW